MPLIIEATQLCHVAIIILSEEFLSSKWPMIELAEFYNIQVARERRHKLKIFPLFFKLAPKDLNDEDRWMPKWKQYASDDNRIDVTRWSAAIKALYKTNGLLFDKIATSEVTYRKSIVQSILTLSPPDLVYGSCENMVGYNRMCKAISSGFVKDTTIGAQVLGLYGMGGLGKTTLFKALCDYFYRDFSGRVCHVELGKMSQACHQELMLKTLCGFEKDVLDMIVDVDKGLTQMDACMKREPVFLVIDNATIDENLHKEVQDYLRIGFHPNSRIVITSRSKVILQDLLPDVEFCIPMPKLIDEEARVLFLKHAIPMKSISMLTSDEQRILQFCIEQCWFQSEEGASFDRTFDPLDLFDLSIKDNKYIYHPLTLLALANFFSRLRPRDNRILLWKDYLDEKRVSMKDVWKSSKKLFDILGLQFSTFDLSEKLLFSDIALYHKHWHLTKELSVCDGWSTEYRLMLNNGTLVKDWVNHFSILYDEPPIVVERKLWDLKKSSMINWLDEEDLKESSYKECMYLNRITMHDLYKEFAQWYVTEDKVKGLKNSWGVFQTTGINFRRNFQISKCWSDLLRLRIFDLTVGNAKLVASKAMQELSNLVVLQLHFCTNLTVLNLKGLDCLCHLELVQFTKLVTIMLPRDSSTYEYAGIYESLQNVLLERLDSLMYVHDFKSYTSLHTFIIRECSKLTNFEGIECSHLKHLRMWELVPNQFDKLPNFKSLLSLVTLRISAWSYLDWFVAHWEQETNETNVEDYMLHSECVNFKCIKLLKELRFSMHQWNRLGCSRADFYPG